MVNYRSSSPSTHALFSAVVLVRSGALAHEEVVETASANCLAAQLLVRVGS